MPSQQPLCPECLQCQKKTGIDIEQFLQKLTAIKQKYGKYDKTLSSQETEYICLSISEYSKGQIAFYFYKGDRRIPNQEELNKWNDKSKKMKIKQLNSEMSSTVHKYVNEFMRVDRFQGWERVIRFLQSNGYDRSSSQNRQIRKTTQIQISIEHDVDESEMLRELQQTLQDKINGKIELRISLEKKV